MSDEPAGTDGSPFADLADFVAIPRVAGLALARDGSRLVTSVATLGADGKKWLTSLWEIDPTGEREARRLTRSAPGEANPVFAPDGSLLFTSKRADPDSTKDEDPKAAVWCLPADGGEARLVASRPDGVSSMRVATNSGELVVLASVMPSADDVEADEAKRTARKDAGVTAILHDAYPVRFWDHDLGLRVQHAYSLGPVPTEGDELDWRDLTPGVEPPHGSGDDVAVSPDGSLLARADAVRVGPASWRRRLVVVDVASGHERVLVDDEQADIGGPSFSADSARIVCVRQSTSTFDEPPDTTLLLVDVADGATNDITADFDRWPTSPRFGATGDTVFFTADDDGRHPVFRVDVGAAPIRLTGDGAYTDLCPADDGSAVYAIRSSVDSPPAPVRLDPEATGQEPTWLLAPGAEPSLPGTVTELDATAVDGSRVQSWLVLPSGASAESPAPLVLWIHGGPLMSWNAWSWRWTPWLLAARGYAVLLPNPGLSQGFGQEFVRRGWGAWGAEPFSDLMAATDAAIERPDIDEKRTAAMGGSFGGYMANWVATQTQRFDAIVTHASLWHLDGFIGATDGSYHWEREFGDPVADPTRYDANSPHRYADAIQTPMLVIHGDKDYRVPIGEGLRLWYDLQKRGVPSKFLYFPDENHWILTPGNATVWYETVFAFLAEHVLDEEWERPELV